jgi:hypothetical protein
MKTRALIAFVAIAAFAGPVASFAIIPVTVDGVIDPGTILFHLSEVANTGASLAQCEQMVQQGIQAYQLATQMKSFAGDPRISVSMMVDLNVPNQSIFDSIGGASGNGGLNMLSSNYAKGPSGVNIKLRLVGTDANSISADDQAIMESRQYLSADGSATVTAPAALFTALDSAEAVARGIKTALVAQNTARAQSAQAYINVNANLASAQDESQKQAAAAQLAAITAQQTILNGQTQQQALEYQMQNDKDKRTEANANLTGQQQGAVVAQGTAQQLATEAAAAKQNQAASQQTVTGSPIDFDYTLIH